MGMLYFLGEFLRGVWGPFRLLQSHLVMLAGGAFLAALAVWLFLPRLARGLPRDRGKAVRTAEGACVAVAGGAAMGFKSLLMTLANKERASSLIYVFKKK